MKLLLIFVFIACTTSTMLDYKFQQEKSTLLSRAVKDIVRSPVIQNVIVFIDDHRRNDRTEVIIDGVWKSASSHRPTFAVTLEKLQFSKYPSEQLAASNTLIIYIFAMVSSIRNMGPVIENIYSISHIKHQPKILLIILPNEITDIKYILNVIWERTKVLEITVLEILEDPSYPITFRIYQLNPFIGNCTTELYSGQPINWFPDKLQNLHRYQFSMRSYEKQPFVSVKNVNGVVHLGGGLVHHLHYIAVALNLTYIIDSREMEISPVIQPYANPEIYYQKEYTAPVMYVTTHLLIPKITIPNTGMSTWKMLITAAVGVIIILIVWFVSRTLKINCRMRHPINLISLLLGGSSIVEPRKIIEIILFLSLVFSSVQYTSIFYTELFGLGVTNTKELEVRNWKELDESGLPFCIYNENFQYVDDISDSLRKKIRIITNDENLFDYLQRSEAHTRCAYYVDKFQADYINMVLRRSNGEEVMKIAKFVPHLLPMVFPLRLRTPFKNRIDEVILRIQESGTDQIIWELQKQGARRMYQRNEDKNSKEDSLPPNGFIFVTVLWGYLITLIVFFMEVFVCRLNRT